MKMGSKTTKISNKRIDWLERTIRLLEKTWKSSFGSYSSSQRNVNDRK